MKGYGVRQRTGAGLIALGLVLAGPALAQQAAPAPAAPATAAPALPEPTAAAVAAARDLVVLSGMARSFAPLVPDLVRQIVPALTRTHPELTVDMTEVVKQLEPEFIRDGERMTDVAARIYARRMTEDQLKQAAAFFRTPAGARYVEVQPVMLDELVVAMQSWTQELSGTMMKRVREEMAKKGHNLM